MKKRRYGQHFLFHDPLLTRIVEVAGIQDRDTIVEIGPGYGTLTKKLSERAKRVIAIEIDHRLYESLKKILSEYKNIELIHGDALRFDYQGIGQFKVVSNLPYSITTPLIFRLLEERDSLKSMTLTLQKEVARRIVATWGNKTYGVLSIMVQYRTLPRIEFYIPKGMFKPAPKVDSAVVYFDILRAPSVEVKDEDLFFRIIKTSFGKRRKTIANSLKPFDKDIRQLLQQAGIEPERRPETLSIKEFAKIANLLKDFKPEECSITGGN